MAEAEGIPPTASIASVGKGVRYIGNHLYAYSGSVTVGSGGAVDAIDFTSGGGYALINFFPAYNGNFSEDFLFTFKLNDLEIFSVLLNDQENQPFLGVDILVPPFTLVNVEITPSGHTTNRSLAAVITGRVYDA